MELWLALSLVVILSWGLWGFAIKLANLGAPWEQVYAASSLGIMSSHIVMISYLWITGKISPLGINKYVAIAYFGGLAAALGGLLYNIAVREGEASIVIPLTSLYPVVSVLLSVLLLGEGLTIRKIVGVALVVLAIIILSFDRG